MLDGAGVVAVSGIRDIVQEDEATIDLGISELLAIRRSEIRFGGARGTDTVALAAACAARTGTLLSVVVPATVDRQPREARAAIRLCAGRVEEMNLDPRHPSSYWARNRRILEGAGGLLAFWDGGPGGTAGTIEMAEAAGIPVEIVELVGRRAAPRQASGFGALTPIVGFQFPVFAWRPYVSASRGLDPLSDYVRRAKVGQATSEEHALWAEMVAGELLRRGLRPDLVVPMPRRSPGVESDLAPLAGLVARRIGARDGTGVLYRHREPEGGRMRFYRLRFPAAEHAATMAVDRSRVRGHPALALVLDNVLTTGGSMGGALEVLRLNPISTAVVGMALLAAGGHAVAS